MALMPEKETEQRLEKLLKSRLLHQDRMNE